MSNEVIVNRYATTNGKMLISKTSIDTLCADGYTARRMEASAEETRRNAAFMNFDNLIGITGMSTGENDMPRKWIKVGTTPSGDPIRKNVYGKNDEDLQLKIAETLWKYGLVGKQKEEAKVLTPFANYAESWFAEHKAKLATNSIATYSQALRGYILPFFGEMYIEDISYKNVQKWLDSMTHLAKETTGIYLRIFRAILDIAIEDNIITKNPAKSKRVSNPCSKAERRESIPRAKLERILKHALLLEDDKKKYIYLLAYSGMRKGEALALKWRDIDFANNKIYIRHSANLRKRVKIGDTKTWSSKRTIALPQTLKNILLPMRGRANLLVVSNKETPMSNRTYEKWFESIRSEIPELKDYSAHYFRHTFLTMLSESNVPIAAIQNQAGHSNPDITFKKYIHPVQESINAIATTADSWMSIHPALQTNIQSTPIQ